MSTASADGEQSDADPQAAVEVTLLGGPDDWHGTTMRVPQSDLDDVDLAGVFLISDHTPPRGDDEDPDPRAVYDPDPDPAPVELWWFRGWFPASTARDEFPRPPAAAHRPADVAVDERGAPLGWTVRGEATPWSVTRHRVHWLYDDAVPGGGDVGIWQLDAHCPDGGAQWELIHDPGIGGWTAAPLSG